MLLCNPIFCSHIFILHYGVYLYNVFEIYEMYTLLRCCTGIRSRGGQLDHREVSVRGLVGIDEVQQVPRDGGGAVQLYLLSAASMPLSDLIRQPYKIQEITVAEGSPQREHRCPLTLPVIFF